MDVPHTTPGIKRETRGTSVIFEALPRALYFLRLFRLYDGSQRHSASVIQAGSRVRALLS